MESEADIPDPKYPGIQVNDELTNKLLEITCNEVPQLDVGKIMEETKSTQIAEHILVSEVNAVKKDGAGAVERENFLLSPLVAVGEPEKKTGENQLNAMEELSGSQDNKEKEGMITDKNIVTDAKTIQNVGGIIQTTDLEAGSCTDTGNLVEACNTEENMNSASINKEVSLEKDPRETTFEGEDKKSRTNFNSVVTMTSPITPHRDMVVKKVKEETLQCDGAKDVSILNETCPLSQKTERATESRETALDKLGKSPASTPVEETGSGQVRLDTDGDLGEKGSMEFDQGGQEAVELSEQMKCNTEFSSVKEVEETSFEKVNPGTLKETCETGLNDMIKDNQHEAHNQNQIKNIAGANSSLSTIARVDEKTEPEADVSPKGPEEAMGENKDLSPTEALTMACKLETVVAVICGDNIVAEKQEQTETTKYQEHQEHIFKQKTEPMKENLDSPLDVVHKNIQTTSVEECPEVITNINKQKAAGCHEEILGDTNKDKTIIINDINNKEIPEDKNLVHLEEKNRSEGVVIPKNKTSNLYVTCPPTEEAVELGDEKHHEVSVSDSGEHAHEAFEAAKEKDVKETCEASKDPEILILKHTPTKREVYNEKLEKCCAVNSEEELKDISTSENKKEQKKRKEKAADKVLQIPTESDNIDKSTFEENVPVMNSAPSCIGEEANHDDQENESRPNSSEEATYESDSADESHISSNKIKNINDQIINNQVEKEFAIIIEDKDTGKQVLSEEKILQGQSMASAGEELKAESSIDDAMMKKIPQREVIELIQTVDGNAYIGIQTKEEHGKATDNFASYDGEITKSEYSYEKEQQKEPDTVIEQYEYVKTTTDRYELPILHDGKAIVEENLKEHNIDAMRSEEEKQKVQNSNTECTEQILAARDSTEEREAKALEDEEEPNKCWNTQGTKGLSPEEIVANDNNLDLIKNSTSMPETPDKETKEGTLEATVAAEEKSLHEVDTRYTVQTESSYLTSEEKDLITTEMSENGSHDKEITADSLNFNDIKDVDILIAQKDRTDEATEKTKPGGKSETRETFSETEDQREITTSETSLDEIPQQNLETPSLKSLQEQKFITAEVRETTETSEKDKTLHSNTEIPVIAETTEENVTLSDNKSISPKNIRFTDIEEENPNNNYQDEDQKLQKLSDKSSELNSERSMNEPVVELSERVNTIETDNSNEIGKVETSRAEKLPAMELLKNKFEYEMAVNVNGSVVDTETVIVEQEDLAQEFGDSSNESPKIKKPPVEFEVGHGDRSDDFETRSVSSLTDKNMNAVSAEQDEKLRSVPESLAKERSYKRSPEINQSNIEEDSYADENQNTDFTEQQISAEDIQGREKIINKEMECNLETLKETTKIKYSSMTEMEFKRHDAGEVIKEQTTDDKTGTKELHMASAVNETVDKLAELGLTPIQSFEATASNTNTEMIKSKAEEDLNQGLEASSVTNPSEEFEKAIEKPTNVLTSVYEVVEEKIAKKSMEDPENCDEKTDVAPTFVTSWGNVQLNDEPIEDFETGPDAKTSETTKRTDCIKGNSEYDCRTLEETPIRVSQLLIHEYGNASESIDVEQLETNDVEVEESKVSEAAPEYKDKSVKEIHEEDTSQTSGEVYVNQIQKQIPKVSEALTQPINPDVRAATNDEFIASMVITEGTSLTQFKLNDQPTKVLNIGSETKCPEKTRIAHVSQQDSEVTSMELEETSRMLSHLPTKEPEKTEYGRMEAEKSEAIDVDVEETKIPDVVSSKDQGNEEIQGTGKGSTVPKVYIDKIEKQIKGFSDASHQQIKQEVEEASSDTISHGKSLQTEESRQQLEDASCVLPFDEKPAEITTMTEKMEDGCTYKENTVVDSLKLEDTSVTGSQLSITESESRKNPIVDKPGADNVTDEETKTLYTLSEPRGDGFEEIHKTRESPTEELTEADEEEEIKEVTAKMNNPFYQAAEAVADCQALDQPHPSGNLREQLLAPSSSSFPNKQKCKNWTTIEKMEDEITVKADTETDETKLEEPNCVLLESPTTVPEDADKMSAIIDTPDANEVEAEEAKTSEATSESQVVEEIHSIEPDQELGDANTEKVVEERKVVTETIFEPNYQVVEAVFVEDIACNQTLQVLEKEQVCEKSSAFLKEQDTDTTTKVDTVKDETQMKKNGADSAEKDATANPCLQDEGASELEVSNLNLTVQNNTQNKAPQKESKGPQEASTVKPQEYIPGIYADPPKEHEAPRKCEKAPIECSSQDAKDQGVMDSENSHKGSVKLPPYPTVKQLLPGQVGEKLLEASNLEFDKTGMVFQSASKFNSPELTYISQGIEIKMKHLKGTITEQRDGENHSKETTEADAAIKKDTPNEKAMISEVILAKHEENRPCDNNEETINVGQLQVTGLTIPQVTDAIAGEATDEKVNENFNEVPLHAAISPTNKSIGTCNKKKVITNSDTNYSPKAMDNEKLEHTSLEPACKGLILKNQEVLPAFSQEKVEGNKDTVDEENYEFISEKQTMETVRVVEEVKSSHCEEEHKKNEEPAELRKVENENKFDQANNLMAITEKGDNKGKHQKEKPYVLFHVENPDVSNGKDIMDLAEAKATSKDAQQAKNSLALSHQHIAVKADPSESPENRSSTASEDVTLTQGSSTANIIQKAEVKDFRTRHASESGQKGIEYGEKKIMGEECQEALENSILMDLTENSLSDMQQKPRTETLQMPDHQTGKRELTGDKGETQTQMAETAQAGEAKTNEENDEQEETYEPKNEESGTYAPVVETSRDSDVKTRHKKSHKILSGVGSKVKHSIAKVKKAIIGKSFHPKIQSK